MTIEDIRALVRAECDDWNWHYHILPVVKYARLLAVELGEDEDMAELAALLHDIGRLRFGSRDHDIIGAREAETILREHGYPDEIVDAIRHCVEAHRGNGAVKPATPLAKIIASADALSHFDIIPAMIQAGLKREDGDIEQAVKWVNEKIERDYHEKLLIESARRLAKDKYEAFRLLVDAMQEYFVKN